MNRIVNARVPEQVVDELETVAAYDGVAVADLLREAITRLLESRRSDPEFRKRVLAAMEKGRQMLEEMGEHEVASRYDLRESGHSLKAKALGE